MKQTGLIIQNHQTAESFLRIKICKKTIKEYIEGWERFRREKEPRSDLVG